MAAFWNDIRFGVRTLARNRGFAIVAILILALGIGANTAIFSIIDGVLLKPLPFRAPERLFALQEAVPKFGQFGPAVPVSAHHFQHWRKEWRAADQIGIIGDITLNLTSGGEPERLYGSRISASLFPLLGVRPQLGRTFLEKRTTLVRIASSF
jgi:putative ABC transport system permease protein